jgi:heme A synthase
MVRLQRFAWFVLLYNVAVIAWGAYVRASGSGAGCGSHWPLCNGTVIPRSPSVATLIEYSHRLTSGLALVAVVALLIWIWRACRPGHPARTGAVLSLVFMLTEAAVGAGLVLFQLVADNASMARALFMAVHLLNTFVLLACLALTAWWLSAGERPGVLRNVPAAAAVAAGCAALLLVSTSGAVAALGDTLYPSPSLGDALRADLSATSHLLIRLRLLHPVFAVATAVLLLALVPRLARGRPEAALAARLVTWLTVAQLGLGFLNVILLAPVWLQIVHLLVADGIWIAFVLLSAIAVGSRQSAVDSQQSAVSSRQSAVSSVAVRGPEARSAKP